MNADTEPQVLPGQPKLTNEPSDPFGQGLPAWKFANLSRISTALAPASLDPVLRNGVVVKPATTTSLPVGRRSRNERY